MGGKKGTPDYGINNRTVQNREQDILISLYKSLVRLHLEYCIQVWCPHLKKDNKSVRKSTKKSHKDDREIKESKL